MTDLDDKAFRGLLWLLATMAASIFIPAGTLAYWQAWLFLTVYFTLSFAITLYLMKFDRELLARRLRGGPGAGQAILQAVRPAGSCGGGYGLRAASPRTRAGGVTGDCCGTTGSQSVRPRTNSCHGVPLRGAGLA